MVIKKWYNRMWVTLTNHVIACAGFTLRESLALWRFLSHLLALYNEGLKSHHQSMGALAICHMVNPALVIALRS